MQNDIIKEITSGKIKLITEVIKLKEKRKIPIGTSDFREIIKKNGYYVDKTLLIDKILQDELIKVKLFTRPRRFGKTLNLSMLKHFFNIRTAEENRELFKGLKVEKTETMKEFGKYPVISLSFKDIKDSTGEESIRTFCNMVSNLYIENDFVKEILRNHEKKEYEAVEKGEEANYKLAIKNLIKYMSRYYGKEVILLIDEYDIPLIEAYVKGYYDEVIDFYRIVFQGALKDTEGLKIGILTGITRIAKENIFSGLNNLAVYSVLGKKYEEFFGFTEEEVEEALKEYEIEDSLEEAGKWYDGYNFNGRSIYNPWSIINYLENKELAPYWINTSENRLIFDSLKRFSGKETLENLENLFNGETVSVSIDERVVFKNLKNTNELWNLMLSSGYLTVKEQVKKFRAEIYELRIPNFEIETFFGKMFLNEFITENEYKFYNVMGGLHEGNTDEFEKKFKEFVFDTVSFNEKDREGLAHGLMIGISATMKYSHYTKSEREAGTGKYEVYLEPKDKKGYGYIIETKVVKDIRDRNNISGTLKKESETAVRQIKENAYYSELMERDIKNIRLIGIAFYGKRLEMTVEKIR